MDTRFASLAKNPRFLKQKRKNTKVIVDKRFAAVFSDVVASPTTPHKKSVSTDKYGRPLKSSVANDLKRFYQIEDEAAEDKSEQESYETDSLKKNTAEKVDSDEENEAKASYGLIRGEGLLESSDEESDAEPEEDELAIDKETQDLLDGDDDEPVVEILGPISRRFAVVNMDWDNIKARDLYKIFDAFRPKSGILKTVSIYKSEFGKERLEREAREGPPKEIFDANENKASSDHLTSLFGTEEGDGKDFNDAALRQYQLDRLRYYYAVVACDSATTASAIYSAVDGTEFEKSANVFDLKYIPDDMLFDELDCVDTATAAELATTARAADFSTAALQHSKAQLTWDLDDPDRIRVTRKRFSKDELKEMDFKAYLASDTEEDSADEEEMRERARKYKSLVTGGDGSGDDGTREANDGEVVGDMEITFVPGLSDNATVKMKQLEKDKELAETDNVFLQERRKRKEKALEKKKQQQTSLKDDEFFNDDSDSETVENLNLPPRKRLSKAASKEKELAELELMMFDESAAGNGITGASVKNSHFDMKDVLKNEKLKDKKGKKAKKAKETSGGATQDDFDIDVNDSRFAEVKTSYLFAIDPTNPQFKKTVAMGKLLDARKSAPKVDAIKLASKNDFNQVKDDKTNDKNELMAMVNSIKRKSTTNSNQSQGKRNKLSK
ncbi:pre-rRNA-processing protein esf1 [Physocladia obscura]|uniref:Pre-rRNA-processing protein esf1 n=1 Tax=Physocladia obscura TaxID=109957 RepID=A0AAD5X9A2_9FUNG|nr:pre-rRNA-processing protein esf1 [Physocladia obscura]